MENNNNITRLYLIIFVLLLNSGLFSQIIVPEDNPDDWLLAFVDVETTGLKPGYHEMIDIGIIISNLNGKELDRLFIRIIPQHLQWISPEAVKVNGFNLERWKKLNAVKLKVAVDSLISFHKKVAGNKNVIMVAYNCAFDAAFLDHLFRSAEKSWRELYYYYILDIPSMAWSRGIRLLHGEKLCEYFGIPDEPRIPNEHTGITGADLNYRLYKKLINKDK